MTTLVPSNIKLNFYTGQSFIQQLLIKYIWVPYLLPQEELSFNIFSKPGKSDLMRNGLRCVMI